MELRQETRAHENDSELEIPLTTLTSFASDYSPKELNTIQELFKSNGGDLEKAMEEFHKKKDVVSAVLNSIKNKLH